MKWIKNFRLQNLIVDYSEMMAYVLVFSSFGILIFTLVQSSLLFPKQTLLYKTLNHDKISSYEENYGESYEEIKKPIKSSRVQNLLDSSTAITSIANRKIGKNIDTKNLYKKNDRANSQIIQNSQTPMTQRLSETENHIQLAQIQSSKDLLKQNILKKETKKRNSNKVSSRSHLSLSKRDSSIAVTSPFMKGDSQTQNKTNTHANTQEKIKKETKKRTIEFQTYKIKRGDCLSCIAKKFKIPYPLLLKHNPINNPDLIFIGNQIQIPIL